MNITKGEYTQFTLQGRVQLLDLYGECLLMSVAPGGAILIFRLFDFLVVLVTDPRCCHTPVAADPVTPEMAAFLCRNPAV